MLTDEEPKAEKTNIQTFKVNYPLQMPTCFHISHFLLLVLLSVHILKVVTYFKEPAGWSV